MTLPIVTHVSKLTTLLDVKNALVGFSEKSPQRADMISALHAIAKTHVKEGDSDIDAALSRISIDARIVAPLLDRRTGARFGYTRQSWANIGWRVRAALKATGAWALFNSPKISFSDSWSMLIKGRAPYSRLRLLAHWASLEGLQPQDIDDKRTKQFREWLATWKTDNYVQRCYSSALQEWNRLVKDTPLLNGMALKPVNRLHSHYSISRDRWPAELLADVQRIIGKFEKPDLDFDGAFEPLKPVSIRGYHDRLLRTLSAYVAASGADPTSLKTVATILEPEAAKLALDFIISWTQRTKPDVKKSSDVHGSAKLLATIAERLYTPQLGAEKVMQLQKMARRRCPARKGMSLKNRELLKVFDDEKICARLLHLPRVVFDRELKKTKIDRVGAVKLMLALGVAQSIEAPLRPYNQKQLAIGDTCYLKTIGSKKQLRISVPASDVKNDVDLDFELSGPIIALYEKYLAVARPLLAPSGNPYLYPGRGGGSKSGTSLSQQISSFTADELGVRLTGQQFRHVIGHLYLKRHVGDYDTVRQLLGHRDINTTMSFYAALDMQEASRRVGRFVAEQREELAPLLRPSSRIRISGRDHKSNSRNA